MICSILVLTGSLITACVIGILCMVYAAFEWQALAGVAASIVGLLMGGYSLTYWAADDEKNPRT